MNTNKANDALSSKAHQWVWSGTTWKTIAEIAKAAQVPIKEVESWIRERRVVAVERDGVVLLPAYEFDEDGKPRAVIARVIAEFEGIFGDMGVAAFFESTSGFLDGARPREIVDHEPERVAAAAKFNADAVRYP